MPEGDPALVRIQAGTYDASDVEGDGPAIDIVQQYEARIAALERLTAKQALEIELLKVAVKNAARPNSATTSVIVGPRASASRKDAGC